MAQIKRLVLDVLKPRHPSILDFANAVAAVGEGYCVNVRVDEVDDKTESIMLTVQGETLDFDAIQASIKSLGGSLHSIDEVEVVGLPVVPVDESPA
jgi:hypothetical protein